MALLLVAAVLALPTQLLFPTAVSTPSIPTVGGVVVQSNVTGEARSVAADANDNFVVAGASGNCDSNGLLALDFTPTDALVAKYNSTGSNLWIRTLSLGDRDSLFAVALDGDGNIYAAGTTSTGTSSSSFGTWGHVVKYNSDGVFQWDTNVTISGGSKLVLHSIAIDGNYVVAGGSALFSTNIYAILVRLDVSGSIVDSKSFDTGFTLPATVNGLSVVSSGTYFIAGADNSGNTLWAKVNMSAVIWSGFTPSQYKVLTALTNAGGHLITAGYDPTGGTVVNTTKRAGSDGSLSWRVTYGPGLAPSYFGQAIDSDASGNAFVSGVDHTIVNAPITSIMDFIVQTTIYAGNAMLSLKYDSSGSEQWHTTYSDTYSESAFGNTLDSYPRLIVVGIRGDIVGVTCHPIIVRYVDI